MKPMMKPISPDRNRRDVDLRALEPHLERQAVQPGVAAAAPQHRPACRCCSRRIARTLSLIISAPTLLSSTT